MEIILKENERIDDLQRNGYRIIQNRSKFCFGMDAVLLSCFAAEGETDSGRADAFTPLRIADLGTGTGIIPLLLTGRLKDKAKLTVTGLEILQDMAEMAQRSVKMNDLEQYIEILQGDIRDASSLLGKSAFDVVTSNPPYMKQGGGLSNPDPAKAVARHELLCTFEDVARESALLLAPGGRFYLVHRPERMAEVITAVKAHGLEPKRLRMVHSYEDSPAVMLLLEAVRGGKPFLKVERPLVIYREKGRYTEEIYQMYGF